MVHNTYIDILHKLIQNTDDKLVKVALQELLGQLKHTIQDNVQINTMQVTQNITGHRGIP